MRCVEMVLLPSEKDATFLVCILCRPNLATIGFIGIIVESGNNTPYHHCFEFDVSEEIGNPALKTHCIY